VRPRPAAGPDTHARERRGEDQKEVRRGSLRVALLAGCIKKKKPCSHLKNEFLLLIERVLALSKS